MGSVNCKCCSEAEISDTTIGKDTQDGCKEPYHYHPTQFAKNKVTLSIYDTFYRDISYPLHYLQMDEFLNTIESAFRKMDQVPL